MNFINYFSPARNYDGLVPLVDVMLGLNNPPQADSAPEVQKKSQSKG